MGKAGDHADVTHTRTRGLVKVLTDWLTDSLSS